MSTEQRGPYHIDRRGTLHHIRAHRTFSPRLSVMLPVKRDGIMYELPAFHLCAGEALVLSMVGEDDVVIDGGNGGAA